MVEPGWGARGQGDAEGSWSLAAGRVGGSRLLCTHLHLSLGGAGVSTVVLQGENIPKMTRAVEFSCSERQGAATIFFFFLTDF